MEMKVDRWEFVVRGTGAFPTDMLRYDACWPRSSDDATAMSATYERRNAERSRVIGMVTRSHEPTVGRWASFGWTVENVRSCREGR
jgi:hypothetical protein